MSGRKMAAVAAVLLAPAGRAGWERDDKLGTPQPISRPRVRELLGETYVLECP